MRISWVWLAGGPHWGGRARGVVEAAQLAQQPAAAAIARPKPQGRAARVTAGAPLFSVEAHGILFFQCMLLSIEAGSPRAPSDPLLAALSHQGSRLACIQLLLYIRQLLLRSQSYLIPGWLAAVSSAGPAS